MRYLVAVLTFWAGAADAQTLPPADIYVLGERHDNPAHHAAQGGMIAQIAPRAVVFEMLTDEQADRYTSDTPIDPQVLDTLFGWSDMGWPDIATYAPIFEALRAVDAAVAGGAGAPGDLSAYGLDAPLPPDQQTAREALQADAHCGALPADLLPGFVARQRETDALLAARTLAALDRHGPPVVLIAGNGHARTDWGVPAAIARVRFDVAVIAVVQGEDGQVPPGGDVTLDAASPSGRPDPCAAFR